LKPDRKGEINKQMGDKNKVVGKTVFPSQKVMDLPSHSNSVGKKKASRFVFLSRESNNSPWGAALPVNSLSITGNVSVKLRELFFWGAAPKAGAFHLKNRAEGKKTGSEEIRFHSPTRRERVGGPAM